MTVDHDNGNHVCFIRNGASAGVYVRQDREFFNPAGESVPAIAALLAALDTHNRAIAAREIAHVLAA